MVKLPFIRISHAVLVHVALCCFSYHPQSLVKIALFSLPTEPPSILGAVSLKFQDGSTRELEYPFRPLSKLRRGVGVKVEKMGV